VVSDEQVEDIEQGAVAASFRPGLTCPRRARPHARVHASQTSRQATDRTSRLTGRGSVRVGAGITTDRAGLAPNNSYRACMDATTPTAPSDARGDARSSTSRRRARTWGRVHDETTTSYVVRAGWLSDIFLLRQQVALLWCSMRGVDGTGRTRLKNAQGGECSACHDPRVMDRAHWQQQQLLG